MTQTPARPEMTVVVPAHNAEATLAEQLAALSRQHVDFTWEVLVCDNGSTDGTADLARQWQERLPHLAVVDVTDRRGAGATRNVGAARGRGRFLAFCDADDVVADDWLAALRAGLVGASLVVGPAEPELLNAGRRFTVSWATQPPITLPFWPRFPAGATNNMAVDAAVFSQVGGFDEALGTAEDIDFCWRVQLAGQTLAVCADAVVHVRKRAGLRAVYRQAYSYGAGARQLRRKYAVLAADYWREHGGESAMPVDDSLDLAPVLARAARSVLRGHPGDAAWRLGERTGAMSGPGAPPGAPF